MTFCCVIRFYVFSRIVSRCCFFFTCVLFLDSLRFYFLNFIVSISTFIFITDIFSVLLRVRLSGDFLLATATHAQKGLIKIILKTRLCVYFYFGEYKYTYRFSHWKRWKQRKLVYILHLILRIYVCNQRLRLYIHKYISTMHLSKII